MCLPNCKWQTAIHQTTFIIEKHRKNNLKHASQTNSFTESNRSTVF